MRDPWEIPQSWAWAESCEIAEIIGGGTPRTDDPTNFDGGDVPWITPADLSGYKEKHISRGARNITKKGLANSGARLMPEGTVLFSSRAPIGYVAIASNPVSTNQGFKSFVLHPSVKSDYAYYYLQRAKDLAVELSSGTTFREISGAKAALIPFPMAPIAEQLRIVAEIEKQFTRLDAAVTALKRVQANLKRYRAAVLKAACEGRLVPAEAELASREGRSYEPASVLLERTLTERRARWESNHTAKFRSTAKLPKDSAWKARYKEPLTPSPHNGRELPEGWIWCTADQVCSQITDGEHIQPPYTESGFPLLSAKHVRFGFVTLENAGMITREDFDRALTRCAPRENDLLIVSVGATTGRAAIVGPLPEFAIVRSVLLLKPLIDPNYLWAWTQGPECQTWIKQASGATAQPHLYIKDTMRMIVPLPPENEIARISTELSRRLSIMEEIRIQLETNLKRAERLRQSILKRAFEGKLVPQDPIDEPANTLMDRIRGTATLACTPGKQK
jgi:type I restriction enzyme S subunit